MTEHLNRPAAFERASYPQDQPPIPEDQMSMIAPQLYRSNTSWNDNVYTDWQGMSAMFDAWRAEHPEYRTWDTSTDDTIVWAEYSPEFGVSVGAIDYDRDEMGGWALYSVPFDVPGLDAFEEANA